MGTVTLLRCPLCGKHLPEPTAAELLEAARRHVSDFGVGMDAPRQVCSKCYDVAVRLVSPRRN